MSLTTPDKIRNLQRKLYCKAIIETGRAPRFHRDWHARFGNELL
jgi:hypothetical protein